MYNVCSRKFQLFSAACLGFVHKIFANLELSLPPLEQPGPGCFKRLIRGLTAQGLNAGLPTTN